VRFSLEGWDWRVWLRKQLSTIKLIIAAAVGVAGGYLSSPPLSPEMAGLLGTVLTLVSRLALDLLDYWVTEDPQ